MHALIFCAGKGSRMGRLTQVIPKPLLNVYEQRSILELNLSRMKKFKFNRIFINYSYNRSLFKKIINRSKLKEIVSLVKSTSNGQGNFILEILKKEKLIEPIIAINGDTLLDISNEELLALSKINNVTVLCNSKLNSKHSLIIDESNNLIGIKKCQNKYFVNNSPRQRNVGYIGIILIPISAFESIRKIQKQSFFGIFGNNDLIETLFKTGHTIKSRELNSMNNYITFNTKEEYLEVQNTINSNYFNF
jgi:NDP-sugar pyrophosphorylase family protein